MYNICTGPIVRKRQNLVKRLIASYTDEKTRINSQMYTVSVNFL